MRFVEMRDMIWDAVRTKVPEGMILPWWALAARAVLYPLDFFYWRMSQTRGYQWQNDTWLINGVTYSGWALQWMAKAQGETYRVTRTGATVTLERVKVGAGDTAVQVELLPADVRAKPTKEAARHDRSEQT
jgi:hypothetical protein